MFPCHVMPYLPYMYVVTAEQMVLAKHAYLWLTISYIVF